MYGSLESMDGKKLFDRLSVIELLDMIIELIELIKIKLMQQAE